MDENDKISAVPPMLPAPVAPPLRRLRTDRILLVVALVGVGLLGWQTYDARSRLSDLQGEVARKLAEGDGALSEIRLATRKAQEDLAGLQGKLGLVDAKVSEAQGQYASLETLYAEFSRARDERLLAEVEQAVQIADQQLQLASNVPAALAALQSADARLAQLDQARFLPARKLLARDIERLRALPLADVPSVALQLETMMGRIEHLPLAFERAVPLRPETAQSAPAAAASPVAEAPGWIGRLANEFWRDFRDLIRIERMDGAAPVLLAPEQAVYLREHLRLRLLSARLALLQREGKLFSEDVRQSRLWLQRYFDVKARSVSDTLAELERLESSRLSMKLPTLDDTQATLRGLKLSSNRR
ncbi:MAG: hypothetical protein CGU28_10005 [Candidatus Dactylopiibacterium carminicum]|nr:MAG: hypothetical protein CGU28_10005 [Candidatus Dactylopiibacterium carminicum]